MPRRLISRSDLLLAGVAAAIATVALGFTLVYRISTSEQLRAQTAANCADIENLKAAISGVLVDGKVRSLGRTQDPAIRKVIQRYYDRQLARFAPQECPNKTGGTR